MTRLVLFAAFAIACSGSEKTASGPTATAHDGGVPLTADASSATTAEEPLTDEQCHRLLRHVLDLGLAEMRANRSERETPTQEQLEAIYNKMISDDETMARCKAQPRWAFDCAIAATSTAALAACEANGSSAPAG